MKKKKMMQILALAAAMAMVMTACGNKDSGNSQESSKAESSDAAESSEKAEEESAEEDAAGGEVAAEGSDVTIEAFVTNPWTSRAPAQDDPYEAYIEQKFGGDWTLTCAMEGEGENELVTRFTSDAEPDLIGFGTATQLDMLYNEGVLLDDWNVYADKIPSVLANMGDDQIAYYTTEDGKLKAVGGMPGGQIWAFMIRQDWLDNLELAMPTTPEELLQVMKAFTFNDPDGNGVDDTYGFTAAGGGSGIGEVAKLLMMYGNPSFYITDENTVSHPILDGSYKEFLDFAKSMVDEKVIDPDWYTLGWDERKPNLFQGAYGICYYPPEALMMETSGGGGSESLATGWTIMDMCGGKLDALDLLSETRCSVSAKTAEDSAKMDIICDFLEKTAGMSDDYLNIRFGAGIEEQMGFVRNEDGSIYAWQDDFSNTVFGQTNACSWGQLIVSRPANLTLGATEVVDIWTERAMKLKNEAMEMDRWSVNYRFLNPDPTVKTEAGNVESQFVSRYILGETDDYDGFVENWLSSGGQELLEDAEQTFRKYGLME